MRAYSVFSGVAGGDLGMEAAGIETAGQIENAKFPRRVLDARFPGVPKHGDVTRVRPDDLVGCDILHGGFPCQDLSVAGRRAGLAGERSGLFHEFARLAAALRPTWLVIENVPGLRSSQSGRDMGIVLGELAELGYGWAYRSLDAQYTGLAQRRERVFIVGCLGDAARAAAVLFESEGGGWDTPPRRETGADVAYALRKSPGGVGQGHNTNYVAATLNSGGSGGGFRTEPGEHLVTHPLTAEGHDASVYAIIDAREIDKDQHGLGVTIDGPMYTLDGTSEHAVAVFSDPRRHDERHGGLMREKPSLNTGNNDLLLAPTLRTNHRNNSNPLTYATSKVYTPYGVRKLTPLECERLQGFPDGYTCLCGAADALLAEAGVSHEAWRRSDWRTVRLDGLTARCTCPDTPRYKALGNAIAVPVFAWIARRIVEATP